MCILNFLSLLSVIVQGGERPGTSSTSGIAQMSGPPPAPAPAEPYNQDHLLDLSKKLLAAVQPRLTRDPVVTGFGEYTEAVLDNLPTNMRGECIEDINEILTT